MNSETQISERNCWIDESLSCCEENCQLIYDPALCFEPGEQLSEEQIPEFALLKQKDQFDNLAKSDLVENSSNNVEKQEVDESDQTASQSSPPKNIGESDISATTDESASNQVQNITENITKKGKAMKQKEKKQRRKYTRKQQPQGSAIIASGEATLGLSDKLVEAWNAHIEALREIKSLALGLKNYGIDIQLPEIMI